MRVPSLGACRMRVVERIDADPKVLFRSGDYGVRGIEWTFREGRILDTNLDRLIVKFGADLYLRRPAVYHAPHQTERVIRIHHSSRLQFDISIRTGSRAGDSRFLQGTPHRIGTGRIALQKAGQSGHLLFHLLLLLFDPLLHHSATQAVAVRLLGPMLWSLQWHCVHLSIDVPDQFYTSSRSPLDGDFRPALIAVLLQVFGIVLDSLAEGGPGFRSSLPGSYGGDSDQ